MGQGEPNGGRIRFVRTCVGVAVLCILGLAMVPQVRDHRAIARDAARVEIAESVRRAIEAFHADHGRWPHPDPSPAYLGWDVSHDGDFVPELVEEGYLDAPVDDPKGDDRHHLRYYVYKANAYGCGGEESFYVLGVRRFESEGFRPASTPTFACRGRDWGREFDWVVGPRSREGRGEGELAR